MEAARTHPLPGHSPVMRQREVTLPLQDRLLKVDLRMEAARTHPLSVLLGHIHQREVTRPLLDLLLRLDLRMDTTLPLKEVLAEVLQVIITMGRRQVNQHKHPPTPQITQHLMAIPQIQLAITRPQMTYTGATRPNNITHRMSSTKRSISLISLLMLKHTVPVLMIGWRMMI